MIPLKIKRQSLSLSVMSILCLPAFAMPAETVHHESKMIKFLNRMGEVIQREKGPCQKVELFTEIAKVYKTIGHSDGVRKSLKLAVQSLAAQEDSNFFESFNDQNLIYLFLKIGEAQIKSGDLDAGRSTFKQALQVANAIADDLLRSAEIRWIASTQAIAGDIEGALQIENVNEDPLFVMNSKIAQATDQVTRGDLHGAIETYHGIGSVEPGNRKGDLALLRSIASAQALAGDREAARKTFQEAIDFALTAYDRSPFPITLRTDALVSIGVAQVRSGLLEDARASFRQARETIQLPGSDLIRPGLLQVVLLAEAESGFTEEALQEIEYIKEHGSQSDLLALFLTIAEVKENSGHKKSAILFLDEAINLVKEMDYPYHKVKGMGEITTLQVKSGDLKGAFRTADLFSGREIKEPTLVAIAIALAEQGDLNRAVQTAALASHEYKIEFFKAMAVAEARRGNFEEALGWSLIQTSPLERLSSLLEVVKLSEPRKENTQSQKPRRYRLLTDPLPTDPFFRDSICRPIGGRQFGGVSSDKWAKFPGIIDILFSTSEITFIAKGRGYFTYDRNSQKLTHFDSWPFLKQFSMTKGKDGADLVKKLSRRRGLTGDQFRVVRIDPFNGDIWAATEGGINYIDQKGYVAAAYFFYEDIDPASGRPIVLMSSLIKRSNNPLVIIPRMFEMKEGDEFYRTVKGLSENSKKKFLAFYESRPFGETVETAFVPGEMNVLVPYLIKAFQSGPDSMKESAKYMLCMFNDPRVIDLYLVLESDITERDRSTKLESRKCFERYFRLGLIKR